MFALMFRTGGAVLLSPLATEPYFAQHLATKSEQSKSYYECRYRAVLSGLAEEVCIGEQLYWKLSKETEVNITGRRGGAGLYLDAIEETIASSGYIEGNHISISFGDPSSVGQSTSKVCADLIAIGWSVSELSEET